MSVEEYARHRGVQGNAVRAALKKGRISRHESGWIDSEKADRDWEINTNPRSSAAGKRNGAFGQEMRRMRAPKLSSPPAPKQSDSLPPADVEAAPVFRPEGDVEQLTKARAVRERYAAMSAKLDYDERTGKTVDRAEVMNAVFQHNRILRDALLALPDRIAAQVAAETDAAVIYDLLAAEIRNTLDKIGAMKTLAGPRRERMAGFGNAG